MTPDEEIKALRESLEWALDALDHLDHLPRKSHAGFCGPEAGCDGSCQDAASFGEQYWKAAALCRPTLVHEH